MKRITVRWAIVFIALIFSVSAAFAGHGEKAEKKTGILLVAFGTSVPKALGTFKRIETKVAKAHPGIAIQWAFTSHIIRDILSERGQTYNSPELALAKMMDEGFTHVAIQSLHTIPGEEFHELLENANRFKGMAGGLERILVGYPLLALDEDIEQVADALLNIIPEERKKDEAVVFMGHGTHHPANAYYAALMYRIQLKDPNVFIGVVEGFPEIDHIRDQLLNRNMKKAFLMPFMSVAGDHAINDMAGDDDDSWKSVLTKAGVECVTIMKGTAEYDVFVDIWADHLARVLSNF